jgi:tRNA pseudouridine32 synthase/23S rRNA pseudouridine746 synthase
MDVTICHADADLVVVDKASGDAVIPARGEPAEHSLVRRLEAQLGARLWVVHRIDRGTSGVVVFARSAEAHRGLCRAFEQRRVDKEYVAFTAGVPEPEAGRIELALHGARRGKSRPATEHEPGAREAATDYRVERIYRRRQGRDAARVGLRPSSGRQHQLRVHLRARGTPILFDQLYGRGVAQAFAGAPCRRLALHASRLRLPTPRGVLDVRAPLSAELVALDAWLAGAP